MVASNASSFLLSFLFAILILATMQIFRTQFASTQSMTILGGFFGSLIFTSLLTAISNFEMNTFGSNFQAKIFPEVIFCLVVAMSCSAFVHRVCVSTCLIFSLIELFYLNRISTNFHGNFSTQNSVSSKKKKNELKHLSS